MPRKVIRGKGKITDFFKSAYSKAVNAFDKLKKANEYLKEKQYATKALEFVPQLADVPILGTVLKTGKQYGYQTKRVGRPRRVGRPKMM